MRYSLFVPLLLATGLAAAAEAPPPTSEAQAREDAAQVSAQPTKEEGPKSLSGISILGNQEAPKSLVIVPWKSSEIGASVGISTMLDDSKQPVDRDVFLRAVRYYEIRSEKH